MRAQRMSDSNAARGMTMSTTKSGPSSVELGRLGILILDASELLVRILTAAPRDRHALVGRVMNIADEGRKAHRVFLDRLDRAYVKPLDQDLLRKASRTLEKEMGLLEQVSSHAALFGPRDSMPFSAQIAEVVAQQSRGIVAALSGMRNGGPVRSACEEIIQLKEEADRIHESGTLHLLDEVKDPLEVIKGKQVIDDLHQASRTAREVAYLLRPLACSRACSHAAAHTPSR